MYLDERHTSSSHRSEQTRLKHIRTELDIELSSTRTKNKTSKLYFIGYTVRILKKTKKTKTDWLLI